MVIKINNPNKEAINQKEKLDKLLEKLEQKNIITAKDKAEIQNTKNENSQ